MEASQVTLYKLAPGGTNWNFHSHCAIPAGDTEVARPIPAGGSEVARPIPDGGSEVARPIPAGGSEVARSIHAGGSYIQFEMSCVRIRICYIL